MLQLPNFKDLPIGILAGCFGNTTATYKFYWFLSLIEAVENGKTTIDKKEIFIKMIANAWYTINYFKVSFGKADKIEEVIIKIKDLEKLDIDLERNAIEKRLLNSSLNETEKLLKHFDKNVPHRFLRGWFPNITDKELEKEIYQLSQQFDNQCLYALYKDKIEINPDWVDYLKLNSGILKAFCYWNLSLFLQVRNPNVPDIPNKLIKSPSACWFAVNKVKEIIEKEFSPNGFNVGFNVGDAAGQTVPHVHIHLIPRYLGNVVNPVGGIRNVISSKGDYLDFPY